MTKRIIQQPSKRNYIDGREGSKGRVKTAQGFSHSIGATTIGAATYLDKPTFEALQRYSADTHKSASWIIRDALINFLAEEGYL